MLPQVKCHHGENRSSAGDIFLSPQPDGGVVTIDASRQARALVYLVQRRSAYIPILHALPSSVARGRSVAWRRKLLSQVLQ